MAALLAPPFLPLSFSDDSCSCSSSSPPTCRLPDSPRASSSRFLPQPFCVLPVLSFSPSQLHPRPSLLVLRPWPSASSPYLSSRPPPLVAGARAFAMELAEEAQLPGEDMYRSFDRSFFNESGAISPPTPPRNNADDVSLHNPLLRLHRMGCGWLGVIVEWDGVIVEDDSKIERESWAVLAEEEGKRPPLAFVLRKAEGMKSEQAISEVLCWSRDPRQLKRLARRQEELFQEMQGGVYRLKPGSREFVLSLKRYNIPMALVSTSSRRIVEKAIEAVGLEGVFNEVVAADDVYRGKPDPEMYLYAAQLLDVIPERCIVFGNSNSSVEAAHDTCMKCVAVAGKHPIYELGAADLVVSRLDNLSFVDLKNLADLDSPEFQPPEPVPEPEMEIEVDPAPQTRVSVYDWW